jgi:predicted membrane protein
MSVSTVIDVPITGGVGEKHVTPQTVAEVDQEYHHGIGEMQIDFTHVDFVNRRTYDVKATVGIGHLLVLVPRDVTVEVHGHAGAGEIRVLDDHEGGLRVDRDTTVTAAGENPPHLVLDLEVGVGQVEVQDAAA